MQCQPCCFLLQVVVFVGRNVESASILCHFKHLRKPGENAFPLRNNVCISTNHLVSSSLLRHPKVFSKMVMGENNRSAASFRKLGDLQRMKNYVLHPFKEDITTENLSKKASKSVTKAFVDSPSEFESELDYKNHEPCTSKKTRRRHAKEKKRTQSRHITTTPNDILIRQ